MMRGREDFNDRQKMVFQLRTLLSDVGHTAFSHLGDWMFQGLDGGEDQHDQDLKDILQATGVADTLERYGFSVEETVFPEIDDWIECPSPDLCVDRVDYGFREILRWGAPSIPMNMMLQKLHDPQSIFDITSDGQLVMTDKKVAKYYAAGFSILPTVHWSHPVHRLQLQLFESAVRSSLIDQIEVGETHPRDGMYGIDSDFMSHFQTWPMLHLQKVMKDIALTQRHIFVSGRRADLDLVFDTINEDDWQFPEFPDPLKPYTWRSREFSKPFPPTIDIEETIHTTASVTANEKGLVVNLPPLKARAIDPPVQVIEPQTDGSRKKQVRRLSEINPSYKTYLAGQRAMMRKGYIATVLMRLDVAQKIVQQHENDLQEWLMLLRRPRNPTLLAQTIKDAELLAAAHSFDVIQEVWDKDIARKRRLGEQGILFGP